MYYVVGRDLVTSGFDEQQRDVEVKRDIDETGKGQFHLQDGTERLATMDIRLTGSDLIVYHTEVNANAKGQGHGPRLLKGMVDYAREHGTKVIALCPFVYSYFQHHEEEFADVWKKLKDKNH